MNWPGWGDVLPMLAVIGALIGAAWSWAKLSDRTVSRAVEKAGREAEKAAEASADRLYERLRGTDFRHVEEGMKAIEDRVGRMDGRLRDALAEVRGIGAVVEDVRRTVAVLAERSQRREDAPWRSGKVP